MAEYFKFIRDIFNMTIEYLFKGFLRRVLKIQIGKIHYLRLNIDIDKINKTLNGFDLPVKELTYEDFLKGDKTVFNGEKLDLIKARVEDPYYKAYGIIENGRLIYSTWISLKLLGLPIIMKNPIFMDDDEGLLEDSYCDPIARGRGLHGKMNNYRIKKLYELGKRRVIALVLDGNIPALKVQSKCGFEELGTFHCGYLFGRNYSTLKKSKFDKN